MLPVLHHDAEGGFDIMTVVYVVGALVVVAAIGFLIWKLIQKRNYG